MLCWTRIASTFSNSVQIFGLSILIFFFWFGDHTWQFQGHSWHCVQGWLLTMLCGTYVVPGIESDRIVSCKTSTRPPILFFWSQYSYTQPYYSLLVTMLHILCWWGLAYLIWGAYTCLWYNQESLTLPGMTYSRNTCTNNIYQNFIDYARALRIELITSCLQNGTLITSWSPLYGFDLFKCVKIFNNPK